MSNDQNNFSKGSEWRKWDLHLHSPKTFLANKYNKLSIDDFVKEIIKSNLAVIGLTNYFRFDKNEIEEIKEKLNKHNITVFPNIEFRTQPQNKDKEEMHIHIIFSDKVSIDKINNFLGRLKTIDKKICRDLTLDDIKNTSLTFDSLVNQLHEETEIGLLEDYLIATCPRGQGSFRPGIKDDGRGNTLAITIDKNTNILFGSDIDTAFFLKKDRYKNAIEKPVVFCSDAHEKEDIGKNFTWIKADPTFEGLKQILYDPKDRIKIQELKPEQKSNYQIIDRVEYENSNGQKRVVHFNQNLNSIIGSRAMGKSNLIKNIACAVDNNQCIEKLSKPFLKLEKFKLYWVDKSTNSINEKEIKEKGILFIPQGYLGELVYERESKFDRFLSDLFKNKVDFKKSIDEYRAFENQNVTQITTTIRELLTLKQTIEEIKNKLIRLGKKSDIESEILKTDKEIKSKNFNNLVITQKELDDYKKLNEEKFKKNQVLLSIEKDLNSFELLKNEEVITSDIIENFEFSEKYLKLIINNLKDVNSQFKKNFIENEITILKKDQKETKEKIQALDIKIDPLKQKLNKHKALLDLTQLLQDKKEILQEVIDLLNDQNNLNEEYKIKIQNLVKLNMYFNDKYKNFNFNMKNLEFSNFNLVIDFDKNNLIDFLEQNINYHNSIDFKEDTNKLNLNSNNLLNDPINWEFEEKKFKEILKQLLESILSDILLIKSGKNKEMVLQELFLNRFKINFSKSITNKNGEEFNNMSDGEKMITILELIFKLDNYNYPVLLDQPEDDLDVKAISKHIVDFLISEKTKRQIIVVSHNSNLVVCADSEEVIEANKSKGKNPNFEYKSGSIENELMRKAIIDVLEGGEEALKKRKNKLNIKT